MERKLFLSSSAVGIDSLLEQFLPLEEGKGNSIAIIPTIDNCGNINFTHDEVEKKHEFLLSKGFEIILIDNHYDSDVFRRELEEINGLFIMGGDPWQLLQLAKRLKIDQVLPGFFAKGGFFMGASAGAMIAGPSMELAFHYPGEDKDALQYIDSRYGLRLTDVLIWPHHHEDHEAIINSLPEPLRCQNIIRIPDNKAVIFMNSPEHTVIEANY